MSSYAPPTPTHIVESTVIAAPMDRVWETISSGNFTWWNLVASSKLVSGASCSELGAMLTLTFKDGTSWTIRILELSLIKQNIAFEVVASEPAALVASVVHSIALRRVTSNNSTFVEWTSDFSNDATSEVIQDSSFKKQEAFTHLAVVMASK